MRSSVGDFPAGALRAIFDRDAHGREFLADRVGAGEVACSAGGTTCFDQTFDMRRIHMFRSALEPGFRVLLQQAEHLASGKQRGFGMTSGVWRNRASR